MEVVHAFTLTEYHIYYFGMGHRHDRRVSAADSTGEIKAPLAGDIAIRRPTAVSAWSGPADALCGGKENVA